MATAKSTRSAAISLFALAAIGLWLELEAGEQTIHALAHVLANLLYTLAAAFFVSVFFIKRLEDARQDDHLEAIERLRQDIQKDVLAAALGKIVRPKIFEAVKGDVLERSCIAKRGRWEIVFDLLPDGRIRTRTQIFYEILNTREDEHEEGRDALTNPTELGEVKSLLVRVEGQEIINTEKNLGNYKIVRENGTFKIPHKYKIPGNGSAESICVYEEFHSGPVFENISSYYPTEELDIRVQFPHGWQFHLESYSASPIECYHKTETTRHYRFEGALLPGQTVSYTLRRASNSQKARSITTTSDSANQETALSE